MRCALLCLNLPQTQKNDWYQHGGGYGVLDHVFTFSAFTPTSPALVLGRTL